MSEVPKIFYRVNGWLHNLAALPHIVLLHRSSQHAVIIQDMQRWNELTHQAGLLSPTKWRQLVRLLAAYPEFRNVFYYRIGKDLQFSTFILLGLAKWLYKPMNTLFISSPEIGPGLFIQHGFATIINAKSIGANCWIYQQVTIGYAGPDKCPTLGDNVAVTAGAKVLGAIHLGDNVVVGANAVVLKNVPPNCTVAGVPASIIRRNGERTKESL